MARAHAPNISKTPSPALPWPCMQISLSLARAQVPNMNKTTSHGHACRYPQQTLHTIQICNNLP